MLGLAGPANRMQVSSMPTNSVRHHPRPVTRLRPDFAAVDLAGPNRNPRAALTLTHSFSTTRSFTWTRLASRWNRDSSRFSSLMTS